MIYAAAAVAMLGLLVLALAVRGRRVDDHPICRRCRFDLVGVVAGVHGREPRCPECGSDLARPRALRRGNRRRRPRLGALGIAIILLGGIPAAWLGGMQAMGVDWNRHKPEWWLAGDLSNRDQRVSDAAVEELTRRMVDGQLSAAGARELIARAMARYPDEAAPWSDAWADLLDAALRLEMLTDEQRMAYVRAAPQIAFLSRSRALESSNWTVYLKIDSPRTGRTNQMRLRPHLLEASLDGIPFETTGRGVAMVGLAGARGGGMLGHPLRVLAPPGRYTFTGRWEFEMFESLDTSIEPITSWQEQYTATLEVLPEGEELVRLRPAPEYAEEIRRSVRFDRLTLGGPRSDGTQRIDGWIYVHNPPVPVAFEVLVRAARHSGEEHLQERLGGVVASPGGSYGVHVSGAIPPGTNLDDLHIILRACPETAAQMLHIDEIWDGELIIREPQLVRPPP
jgi:hypothetical protein